MNPCHLTDKDFLIVKTILRIIPNPVYLYGSRARGSAQPFSDIDLYIEGPVREDELTELRAQFEESNLPMKVDLTYDLSPTFLKQIQKDFVRLQ